MPSDLFFVRYAPKNLSPKNSVGAKWVRLLDRIEFAGIVSGKRTAVKMHLGGGHGFTTIHPFFARKLVQKLKDAGAKDVFVTDSPGAVRGAVERGYTAEVLGCPLVPVTGSADRYCYKKRINPPFLTLDEVELAGQIVDAEALIDFSHVKGHGCCSFGGASKNLSMGCVTGRTRGKLHALEGGLAWDKEKCTHCNTCIEECPNDALSCRDSGEMSFNYHNCKYCQHCVLICPEKALSVTGKHYRDFQRGMALATSQVLKAFDPKHVLFINMLMNVTIWCDCWGMSTPALVPDIGILAGRDIVAIEQATLDLIRTEDLIPGSLPPGWELGTKGHLFERIHRKDPYAVVEELAVLGWGDRKYRLVEVG